MIKTQRTHVKLNDILTMHEHVHGACWTKPVHDFITVVHDVVHWGNVGKSTCSGTWKRYKTKRIESFSVTTTGIPVVGTATACVNPEGYRDSSTRSHRHVCI